MKVPIDAIRGAALQTDLIGPNGPSVGLVPNIRTSAPLMQDGDILLLGQLQYLKQRLSSLYARTQTQVIHLERVDDALALIEKSELACVVLDVDTIDMYGPKLVGMIKSIQPDVWVVTTGRYVLPEFREQLFRAGADGFQPLESRNLSISNFGAPTDLHSEQDCGS